MGHGGLQAIAVWTQVPVASRTVEVNTKTGFSLTAGSYEVRASSTQAGSISIGAGVASNTATISSVTTTRALVFFTGSRDDTSTATPDFYLGRLLLTNGTTVTASRENTTTVLQVGYGVEELF